MKKYRYQPPTTRFQFGLRAFLIAVHVLGVALAVAISIGLYSIGLVWILALFSPWLVLGYMLLCNFVGSVLESDERENRQKRK